MLARGEDHKAREAADWRSGPRRSILSVLCPVHPFPLRGTSPQGETRDMRRKTESHIFHVPFRCFPLWWLAPPPFPRSSVGRQKESALMGRLGALLRPTWRSYAGPPQWHYKAPLCCERLMKGMFRGVLFCPLYRGKSGAARIGGGERSEPVSRMFFMPYGTARSSRNADFILIAR